MSAALPRTVALAVLVLGGLTAPVHADTSAAHPSRPAASQTTITIKDFAYSNPLLLVSIGDTVTWTNQDKAPHDAAATAGPAKFKSPLLTTGASWSFTFTAPGSYSYICSVHPQMRASVTAAGTAATTTPEKSADTPAEPAAAKPADEPAAAKPAAAKPAGEPAAAKPAAAKPAGEPAAAKLAAGKPAAVTATASKPAVDKPNTAKSSAGPDKGNAAPTAAKAATVTGPGSATASTASVKAPPTLGSAAAVPAAQPVAGSLATPVPVATTATALTAPDDGPLPLAIHLFRGGAVAATVVGLAIVGYVALRRPTKE